MATSREFAVLVVGMLGFTVFSACRSGASSDPEKDAYYEMVAADEEWDEWSPERRTVFLQSQIALAMEEMNAAESSEIWERAEIRGSTALSLLRVELWGRQRDDFISTESEFELLADETRPSF